ncbi:MAG: ABC transporter permease [Lachnospiraceae bacterium]|nr:ABC transporter permease [Lachnospiraceae bacterium]
MKNNIGKFLGRRAVRLLLLLVATMCITFFLMEISPIDPVTAYVGTSTKVSAEQRALIAEKWGLNQPPLLRFWSWFSNMIRGDWGESIIYRRPVMEIIGQKFLASAALMCAAWLLSGLLGFVLGIIAGVREDKLADKLIRGYCHVLISAPTFWIGIVFLIIFSVKLGWLPVALSVTIGVVEESVSLGDRLIHMVLPVMTLCLVSVSNICMHTREKTTAIMNSDYVLFARARGESTGSIIKNHLLRNISLPAITLQFLSFSELFGGAVFVEQIFSYPGLGSATVQAGLRGDVQLLMGITIISMIFVFAGNTIADCLYYLIDPRIREGGAKDV